MFFDKMDFSQLRWIVPLCILLPIFGKTQSCSTINITCGGTGTGYTYEHGAGKLNGTEIEIIVNEIVLGRGNLGMQTFELEGNVTHMDSNSVTMRDCRNIRVKILSRDDNDFVKEQCTDIQAIPTDATPTPPEKTHDVLWITFSVLAVVLVAFITGMLWCYKSWKKSHSQGRVSEFLRYLLTVLCLRKEETGAGGEPEQGATLQTVAVVRLAPVNRAHLISQFVRLKSTECYSRHYSTDSMADGRTPLPNGDIQATTNTHAMNGSMRDDPGGVNINERNSLVCGGPEVYPEDHKTDRLLQRNLKNDPGGANRNERNNLVRGGPEVYHDAKDHETDRLLQSRYIRVPTSDHTMNGSLWNDPGGVNRNKRNNLVREGPDVDHSAEDHKTTAEVRHSLLCHSALSFTLCLIWLAWTAVRSNFMKCSPQTPIPNLKVCSELF
ncbi:uncharacterized protein LOC114440549 isoform X2 [Parambassis ranga]|uniref:Uncharacterized protein LOC114440549 isoform X2 n=1 Tax=Parambassis ranga TaxID=210632 RepID=A0A6P7ISY1_9TELE|nr:uncharacterized protein LOC114440549 isoform X2 [Parambassis ranga]